jgi:hypothetical protein
MSVDTQRPASPSRKTWTLRAWQSVGPVKTEASRKLMPIDKYVAQDLLAWYEMTPYKKPSHYVWATDANRAGPKRGRTRLWWQGARHGCGTHALW